MYRIYKYVIFLILCASAFWYGYAHKELFLNLKELSIIDITIIFLLVFATQITNAYKFKCLMKIFKMEINFQEWFGLTICGSMFNYYLPARGGGMITAYYLKNKYKLSYSHYLSALAGSYIIAFLLSSMAGLILVLLEYLLNNKLHVKLLGVFAVFLLLTLSIVFFLKLFFKISERFKNKTLKNTLKMIREGLNLFRKKRELILPFSIAHLGLLLFGGMRLYVCFSAIGVKVSLLHMVIVASLVTFSMIFFITPANLGIREGVILFCVHLLGLSVDKALLGVLIDRVAIVILTFCLGLIFSHFLLPDIILKKGKNV